MSKNFLILQLSGCYIALFLYHSSVVTSDSRQGPQL